MLTLGYLNPALNNPAQYFILPGREKFDILRSFFFFFIDAISWKNLYFFIHT